MESRKHFAQQVAKRISENHQKGDESFIFGISGKWGEGKTVFLGELERELTAIDASFRIYKINPWKYASDKHAFLRIFLKALYTKDSNWLKRLRDALNDSDEIGSLDTDVTRISIHGGWLFTIVLYTALASIAYYFWVDVFNFFKIWCPQISNFLLSAKLPLKILGAAILLPTILVFIGKALITQRSFHSIKTIDEFDGLLAEVLSRMRRQGILPVIFVDDLDRVTPQAARDVLDNLRTFFDKPDLSFVVTGDHSVLERYLGNELFSNGTEPEQIEEGRRFLKKIFNVYWRLPLPVEYELKGVIDDALSMHEDKLKMIFSNEGDLSILQRYLGEYFEKNFRQITRFLDTLIFTFEIIYLKEGVADSQKAYYEDLRSNPLLVVRILMIQELCPPLFEKILGDAQILGDLEYAVEQKNSPKVNEVIKAQLLNKLSPTQDLFIRKFLYEEPRFYRNSSLVVSDLRPFLYLAADSSFGDSRGPSGKDFLKIVDTGDPEQIKNSLLLMGEKKAEESTDEFVAQIENITDDLTKAGRIETLLTALAALPREYLLHKIFAERMSLLSMDFNKSLSQQQKMINYILFWKWLDMIDSEELSEKYLPKFPYQVFTDFDSPAFLGMIRSSDVQGDTMRRGFTSKIVLRWLISYHPQNPADAESRMKEYFPHCDQEIVKEEFAPLGTRLIDIIASDSEPGLRGSRFELVSEYSAQLLPDLKTKVLNAITNKSQTLTKWAIDKIGDAPWTKKEVGSAMLKNVSSASDYGTLFHALMFMVNNQEIIAENKSLWKILLSSKIFIDHLVEFSGSLSFVVLAPDEDDARTLLDGVLEKIRSLPAEIQNAQILTLKKDVWVWKNMNKLSKKKLGKLAELPSATEVLATWSQGGGSDK